MKQKARLTNRAALYVGGPMPQVAVKTNYDENSAIGNIAGRHALICVYGREDAEASLAALRLMAKHAAQVGRGDRVLVAVSNLPGDRQVPIIRHLSATIIVVWDHDFRFVDALGLLSAGARGALSVSPSWILVDPMYRVAGFWRIEDGENAIRAFSETLPVDRFAGVPLYAPVLLVPHIFESDLSQRLIDYYRSRGGTTSGVARDLAGKTENVDVPTMKKRSDCTIEDSSLRAALTHRLKFRLFPQIEKALRYHVTRIERFIVACYSAETGGFFRAHRDNTSAATVHRAFAVTINLNVEEYEGGDLRFPEYGSRAYRAPTGGAIVFSTSLLHEALPVTRGERFAFLPFLYNEEGESLREQTAHLAGATVRS